MPKTDACEIGRPDLSNFFAEESGRNSIQQHRGWSCSHILVRTLDTCPLLLLPLPRSHSRWSLRVWRRPSTSAGKEEDKKCLCGQEGKEGLHTKTTGCCCLSGLGARSGMRWVAQEMVDLTVFSPFRARKGDRENLRNSARKIPTV